MGRSLGRVDVAEPLPAATRSATPEIIDATAHVLEVQHARGMITFRTNANRAWLLAWPVAGSRHDVHFEHHVRLRWAEADAPDRLAELLAGDDPDVPIAAR